ncbi:poly(A)-specific ribonuclease [Coemansia brasiliensis]|uniref:Poly(A)-specific ribonuclease n=1 Tax=Coemansia brasiliensis TaxID=2650707 RepID=A0A9W8I831_9FUNG|nr:poly(A)-specific ribonuclease [Coemansia brasiliensis]
MEEGEWFEYTQSWDAAAEDMAWPVLALAARKDSELIYAGDSSGRLTTYTLDAAGEPLARHTSVQCAQSAIRHVAALEAGGVFVQSGDAVQVLHDSGRQRQKWATTPNDAFVGACTRAQGYEAFVCTSTGSGTLLDLQAGRVAQRKGVDASVSAMSFGDMLFLGTAAGELAMRDPRASFSLSYGIAVGTGAVSSIALYGNDVFVACQEMSTVSIYDQRNMSKPVRSIACDGRPVQLHAGKSDLWISYTEGFVDTRTFASQCNDVGMGYAEPALSEYAFVSAFAVTPSEQALLVADTEGVVHIWADREQPQLSATGQKPELLAGRYASQLVDSNWHSGISLDDESVSLASIKMPAVDTPLLSRMDADLLDDVGRPACFVDAGVLSSLKMLDNVGYAPKPHGMRRNQLPFSTRGWRKAWRSGQHDDGELTRGRSKFLSQQRRSAHGRSSASALSSASTSTAEGSVPKHLRQMRIEYSRFGVEDFDFSLYNSTQWSGLEGNVRNSYANALLQLLFFCPEFRQLALSHCASSCADATCLSCQLGLLFRLLQSAQGHSCHATLLLHVLAQRPEATALAVLEDTHGHATAAYAVLVQRLMRLVLEQANVDCRRMVSDVNQEQATEASIVERAFGFPQLATTTCPSCNAAHYRESHVFSLDLDLPQSATGGAVSTGGGVGSGLAAVLAGGSASVRRAESMARTGRSQKLGFLDFVNRAVVRTDTQRAWCTGCKKFQLLNSEKRMASVPEAYLTLNFPLPPSESASAVAVAASDPGTSSPLLDGSSSSGASSKSAANPWQMALPTEFNLHVAEAQVQALSTDELSEQQPEGKVSRFELVAVISSIRDTRRGPEHLVAHIRDPDDAQSWLLFNDFLVQRVQVDSVTALYDWWRLPSVAVYANSDRTSLQGILKMVAQRFPYRISTRILTAPRSSLDPLQTAALQQRQQRIRKGMAARRGLYSARTRNEAVPLFKAEAELLERGEFVCALDAEFVVLEDAQMEVFSDGTRHVLRPAVHALARLSAVRANGGEMHGVPFIDDYVEIARPVYDLATIYSGIHAGDLNVGISRHALSTMKEVYKKLRLLVDCKCVFIGHGLKHDFRVCNIFVPQELQRDTMLLFQSPSHIRPISLRFLYWYFKRKSIQMREHSSVEDAQATLSVYECYSSIMENDQSLESVLDDIYAVGSKMSWKLPEQKV